MMEFPIDPELRQELSGDEAAMKLQALFQEHHARLQRLVRIRLDSRLRGRVRSATVLERAFLRMRHELAAYVQFPELSPYVWMRKVTGDALSPSSGAEMVDDYSPSRTTESHESGMWLRAS